MSIIEAMSFLITRRILSTTYYDSSTPICFRLYPLSLGSIVHPQTNEEVYTLLMDHETYLNLEGLENASEPSTTPPSLLHNLVELIATQNELLRRLVQGQQEIQQLLQQTLRIWSN